MRDIQNIKKLKKSTQKTAKITHAMQLVSASKLAKTQENKDKKKEYSRKIREVLGHIACSIQNVQHPYLEGYEMVEKVVLIVVSTDRGLCGNLNTSLFKKVLESIVTWQKQGVDVEICTIGRKAHNFFEKMGFPIISHSQNLEDIPKVSAIMKIIQICLAQYQANEAQEVYVFNNQFVNTMTQKPQGEQLLPVPELPTSQTHYKRAYDYEPNEQTVLQVALDRYIESIVYQAVVENIACEQAARMLAMKNATDDAKTIIHNLDLAYNKARQALITSEIAEIVAGAEALD